MPEVVYVMFVIVAIIVFLSIFFYLCSCGTMDFAWPLM